MFLQGANVNSNLSSHINSENEKDIKTVPDLFVNKSFNVGLGRVQTQLSEINDKSVMLEDKSILNQTVNSCLICFDKSPNAVFMDCGHGGKFIPFKTTLLNLKYIFIIREKK